MDEFLAKHVKPFYLAFMGLNATRASPDLRAAARASSAAVGPDKVRELLAADWRPRVMGAWYAVSHPTTAVGDALAASVETCRGSLTAPPLATAACLVLGPDAVPSLTSYARAAAADPYLGSDGYVAAVLERLGGPATDVEPADSDRRNLEQMLSVAEELRRP